MSAPHSMATPRQANYTGLALWMFMLLSACASTQVSEAPASATNFSGTWKLNDELSEDASEIVRSTARSSRSSGGRAGGRGAGGGGRGGGGAGPGGGGGRGGAGGGGGRRGGGGGGGGSAAQPLADLLDEVTPDENTLVIEQSADRMRVKYGDRDSAYHGFDSTRFVQLAGQDAERLSGWQDNDFLVETSTDGELKVTERLTLSPDGRQITQLIEIDAERLPAPISVTRVFDRAE